MRIPVYLAIDESMIPYFGKHFAKQVIRGKPIRFGYKMWTLCSNGGYLHSFNIYMGKKENEAFDIVPSIGLGGNVVLNLIAKANLPSNHNHILFFDNYFTSIPLMEELISQGYLATGTCRDNRSDKCPISEENFLKHQPRGAVDYRMSDGILLMKWKDNKEVTVASNFDSTILKSSRHYDLKEKNYKGTSASMYSTIQCSYGICRCYGSGS